MFNAILGQQCHGEAIDHNDDRPLASLSPYPKFTLQKRLQTGVRETNRKQQPRSETKRSSQEESRHQEKLEKKTAALFPPVVCGRRSLSLAHGPVGFPVSFHDLAGITQKVLHAALHWHCLTGTRTRACECDCVFYLRFRQIVAISTISFMFQHTNFSRAECEKQLNSTKTRQMTKMKWNRMPKKLHCRLLN